MPKTRPTVLLVDDDANTLIALGAILEQRKIRVLDTDDESGAIRWCDTVQDPLDVLIVDVILQGTTGPAVVRKLRTLQPSARVLFISGFDLKELGKRKLLAETDLAAGSVEFLQKPFTGDVFIKSVEKLISARDN